MSEPDHVDDASADAAGATPPPPAAASADPVASPPASPATTTRRRASAWLARAAAAIVLLAALAHNLSFTWNRWGDLIVDCGRELDVPRQLLDGKLLYRDVRYWYGPLAPYANAAWYGLFGVNTRTLTTAGIVIAVLVMWLVYRIVRRFASRPVAVGAGVLFLYACAFGHYYGYNIFEFPLPYAFSATYGILFATASVYFLLRHVASGRARDLLPACALLSLAALCKLEVVFAAGVAHGAFLIGRLIARQPWRWTHLVGYVGAIVVPACVYGCFRAAAGPSLWIDNLFLPGNVAASPFTLEHSGLDSPAAAVRQYGLSALGAIGWLVVMATAARLEHRIRDEAAYDPSMRAMAIAALVVAGALAVGGITLLLGVYLIFRALPILLLVLLAWAGVRLVARPESRARSLALLVLAAFGLAGLSRMVLKCGAEHYGFYLLVPGLIGLAVLWGRLLPRFVSRIGTREGTASRPALTATACGVCVLVSIALSHFLETRRTAAAYYLADGPRTVTTSRGAMALFAPYAGSVDEAVRFLAEQPPQTRVVVVPEGAAITFLAGCTNPLGVHTFLPLDFSGAYDDAHMAERLTAADPDFIVRTARDVNEYGSKGFGVDYARETLGWIQTHYRPAKQYRTRQYMVVIYARKP